MADRRNDDPAGREAERPGEMLGSVGFSWYVDNLGKYNQTYGALAAVIILLLWLFLSAFVVLLGESPQRR